MATSIFIQATAFTCWISFADIADVQFHAMLVPNFSFASNHCVATKQSNTILRSFYFPYIMRKESVVIMICVCAHVNSHMVHLIRRIFYRPLSKELYRFSYNSEDGSVIKSIFKQFLTVENHPVNATEYKGSIFKRYNQTLVVRRHSLKLQSRRSSVRVNRISLFQNFIKNPHLFNPR